MRRPAAMLLAAALAMVAAGCGFKSEPTSDTITPSYPLTVTDAVGRSVHLAVRPSRVTALDPGAAGLLRRLGVNPRVLPDDSSPARIARGRPELVVLPATSGADEADALAQQLKTPTFISGGGSLPPIEHASAQLGLAVGHGVAGRQLALELRRQRLAIEQKVQREPAVRVFIDTGLGLAPPRNSLLVRLVREAGGKPVGLSGAQPVSPARFVGLRPQVYLATSDSGVSLARLEARPKLAQLPAVRDRRVMIIDLDDLAANARAYDLFGRIAHELHPGAFS